MTSPREVVLVAPGTVTRREWEKEPVELPLSEFRSYDRLARELEAALATPVRLADGPDAGAWALLVPAGSASARDLPEDLRARTLLLDASPAHQVHVVRQGLLGAVMEDRMVSQVRSVPRSGSKVSISCQTATNKSLTHSSASWVTPIPSSTRRIK